MNKRDIYNEESSNELLSWFCQIQSTTNPSDKESWIPKSMGAYIGNHVVVTSASSTPKTDEDGNFLVYRCIMNSKYYEDKNEILIDDNSKIYNFGFIRILDDDKIYSSFSHVDFDEDCNDNNLSFFIIGYHKYYKNDDNIPELTTYLKNGVSIIDPDDEDSIFYDIDEEEIYQKDMLIESNKAKVLNFKTILDDKQIIRVLEETLVDICNNNKLINLFDHDISKNVFGATFESPCAKNEKLPSPLFVEYIDENFNYKHMLVGMRASTDEKKTALFTKLYKYNRLITCMKEIGELDIDENGFIEIDNLNLIKWTDNNSQTETEEEEDKENDKKNEDEKCKENNEDAKENEDEKGKENDEDDKNQGVPLIKSITPSIGCTSFKTKTQKLINKFNLNPKQFRSKIRNIDGRTDNEMKFRILKNLKRSTVKTENNTFGDSSIFKGISTVVSHKDDIFVTYNNTVYYYIKQDSWIIKQKLMGEHDSLFGGDIVYPSVALYNDWAVIGAPNENYGCVYIYKKVNGYWVFHQKIIGDDNREVFGYRVALNKKHLVVASYMKNSVNDSYNDILIYGLDDDNLTWSYSQTLETFNEWIDCLTMGKNYIVVTLYSSQSVAIYKRFDNIFIEEPVTIIQKPNGDTGEFFGLSTSLSKKNLIIGSPGLYSDNTEGFGNVYFYKLNDKPTINPCQIETKNIPVFGWSVNNYKNNAVVGSFSLIEKNGCATVYSQEQDTYIEKSIIKNEEWDFFGASVSITEHDIVVGAHTEKGFGGNVKFYDIRDTSVLSPAFYGICLLTWSTLIYKVLNNE
jgi:hypothetical protein